jgi:hypothetical protein
VPWTNREDWPGGRPNSLYDCPVYIRGRKEKPSVSLKRPPKGDQIEARCQPEAHTQDAPIDITSAYVDAAPPLVEPRGAPKRACDGSPSGSRPVTQSTLYLLYLTPSPSSPWPCCRLFPEIVQYYSSQILSRFFTLGPEPQVASFVLKPFPLPAPLCDPLAQALVPSCV